jgi:hypothetical protein
MNRILAILLISVFATAQTQAPAPPSSGNDSENAKKARDVIDKGIEALGGQAYLNNQNKGEEGRLYNMHHGDSGGGVGAPYRYFSRFPDKDRLEIIKRGSVVVPLPLVGIIVVGKQVKDKNDMVIIHNGDKGYEVTFKGTAALDREDLATYLRRRRHSLDQVLRKWVNDPTLQYFYDGMTLVDSKATDQVTVLNSENDSVTLYFDQNSHLPIKTSYTWRDPKDKQKNTEEEVYDNYRPVQGVMTPFSVSRYYNGDMTAQRFINTAAVNQDLPADLFDASISYDPLAPSKKK